MRSLQDRLVETSGRPRGFDYLRLALALGVIAWHGFPVTYSGDNGPATIEALWAGPWRPAAYFIVPGFFALSGFLVAGSLERNPIPQFLTLRAMRIFPALTVETLISALILGPLLTTVPLHEYFSSKQFFSYFLNIIGLIHYELPGVFDGLPAGNTVNKQLWTVPYEFDCYFAITVLALLGFARKPIWLLVATFIAMLLLLARHRYGLHGAIPLERGSRPPGSMLLLSFLYGASFFLMRRRVPFSRLLFLLSGISYTMFVTSVQTEFLFLAVPPLVYIIVFLGLLDPPRTPFVVGADYSYGIYLYGFPLLQTVSYLLPSHRTWLFNVTLSTALALACAFLSWTFVETKILDQKSRIISFVSTVTAGISQKIKEFFRPLPKWALVPIRLPTTPRWPTNEP